MYEPHIAPRVEAWAEEFLERRRAARNRDPGAVPVSAARRRRRRRSRGSAASSGASHHSNDVQGDLGEGNGPPGPNTFLLDEFELEALASKEVDEWRNEVLRSQERNRNNLRRRHTDRFRDGLDSVDNTSTTFDEVSHGVSIFSWLPNALDVIVSVVYVSYAHPDRICDLQYLLPSHIWHCVVTSDPESSPPD